MRFVRQHLWRSDFGDNDLFLDIIYVPREHLRRRVAQDGSNVGGGVGNTAAVSSSIKPRKKPPVMM